MKHEPNIPTNKELGENPFLDFETMPGHYGDEETEYDADLEADYYEN